MDERRRSVLVQTDYVMTPKRCESVLDDVTWFQSMEEGGSMAAEYVDDGASRAIAEPIRGASQAYEVVEGRGQRRACRRGM